MVYKWKDTFFYKNNADVSKVKKEIDSLGVGFTPDDVVEKAQNEKSELNKCFEWDREKVYQAGLKHQARQIVSSIIVYPEQKEIEPVRVYESVVFEDKKSYVPVEVIVKEESLEDQIIIKTLTSIKELNGKLKSYEYVSNNIKRLSEKTEKFRNEIEGMNLI